MEIKSEKIDSNIFQISICGRMDVPGTDEVDFELAVLAGSIDSNLLVDISGVIFLSSTGMRTLLSLARAQAKRGDTMVMVGPQPQIKKSLVVTGIEAQIPIFDDVQAAITHLKQL